MRSARPRRRRHAPGSRGRSTRAQKLATTSGSRRTTRASARCRASACRPRVTGVCV